MVFVASASAGEWRPETPPADAASATSTTTASAASARAGVEKSLAAMREAILAKDVAAYLTFVDGTDAIFFKEQQNWAKDLLRKPVASVTLSIGEPGEHRPERFDADRATFELVMAWELPPPADKPDAEKRHREASFPAVFIHDAASGTWKFAGENWIVLDHEGKVSPKADGTPSNPHHVRVKYLAGYEAVAKTIAEVLPEVREHVDEGFGVNVTRVQEVKIYPTMRHLQASIYLSYTEGLSGWNEPGEAIKLLVRPSANAKTLKPLLAHEYGHVATFELGDKATDMPWWILEGVAELSAEKYDGSGGKDAERAVIRWHKHNALAEWSSITDFFTTPSKLGTHVYKQGQHMVGFVSLRAGRAGRNKWLAALAHGRSLDDATREAMGMSFAELDAAWRAEVKRLAEADDAKQNGVSEDEPQK